MTYRPSYTSGSWKTVCDQCGRQFKSNQLRQRWDGLMTCANDWEPRHPQDFVKGVADLIRTPWARPEAPSFFMLPSNTLSDMLCSSSSTLDVRVILYDTSKHEVNASAINSYTVG
jgi:hypothetical protein